MQHILKLRFGFGFTCVHHFMQSCEHFLALYNTTALFTVPFPKEGQQKSAGKMVQKTNQITI